jgi:hypothetical protein
MSPEIWLTLGMTALGGLAGHILKRLYGPPTMKTQAKRMLLMFVVLMAALLAVAAFDLRLS